MFSRLDSLFKVQDRHAERLDTRQAIRRHDPDRKQHGDDHDNAKDQDSLWEDSTSLSITSLQSFLESLILQQSSADPKDAGKSAANEQAANEQTTSERTGTKEESDGQSQTVSRNQPSSQSNPHSNTAEKSPRNARAAQAYQRSQDVTNPYEAARKGKERAVLETQESIQLSTEEIRTIHQIIQDLKALSAAGAQVLPLNKSASFLQSIIDAIEELKNPQS